jgi:hypothetical protein
METTYSLEADSRLTTQEIRRFVCDNEVHFHFPISYITLHSYLICSCIISFE